MTICSQDKTLLCYPWLKLPVIVQNTAWKHHKETILGIIAVYIWSQNIANSTRKKQFYLNKMQLQNLLVFVDVHIRQP